MNKLIMVLGIFVIILPIISGQIAECDDQEKGWQIQKCYSDKAIELNKRELCDFAGDYKGTCYYKLAVDESNPNVCESAEGFKRTCYNELALTLRDEKLCEQAGSLEQECYFELAMDLQEGSLCEKTKGDECWIQLAILTKNESLCSVPKNTEECFWRLYESTGDKGLCQFLDAKREECLCKNDEYLNADTCVRLECKKKETAQNHQCVEIQESNDYICVLEWNSRITGEPIERWCGSVTITEYIGSLLVVIAGIALLSAVTETGKSSRGYKRLKERFVRSQLLYQAARAVFLNGLIASLLVSILMIYAMSRSPYYGIYVWGEYGGSFIRGFFIIFLTGLIVFALNKLIKNKYVKSSGIGAITGIAFGFFYLLFMTVYPLEDLFFWVEFIYYPLSSWLYSSGLIECGKGHPDLCEIIYYIPVFVSNTMIGIILGLGASFFSKIVDITSWKNRIPEMVRRTIRELTLTVLFFYIIIRISSVLGIPNRMLNVFFANLVAPLILLDLSYFGEHLKGWHMLVISMIYVTLLYSLWKVTSWKIKERLG